jgi:hypothetical protein
VHVSLNLEENMADINALDEVKEEVNAVVCMLAQD